ncbi:MAG TPA: thiolase family protein [Baekduia sp.]
MPVAGNVAIVGSAATLFGVHHERSYHDLLREAANGAIADAGLQNADVQAAWLSTAVPDLVALEGDSGTPITETIGFAPRPVTRVSAYCASGMEAVRGGALAIAAGEFDVVLVAGVEKMRDVAPRESLVARTGNMTHPTLAKGRSGPGGFAMLASRYLHEYERTTDDLDAVAVKAHEHATRNPIAQYSEPVTAEQVRSSPFIADPLRVLDCTPTTDGAAAVILASVDWARARNLPHAVLDGVGFSVTEGYYSSLFNPEYDFLGFRATREASRIAYAQAGIEDPRADLDLVECHDCFTITEIVNYEDLGLCAPGTGWSLLLEGATTVGGDIPVNLSGGLQSCGHPIGATGVRVVKEVADQVIGRAGARQVSGARRGLAHTLGGPGVLSCVMVLSTGTAVAAA